LNEGQVCEGGGGRVIYGGVQDLGGMPPFLRQDSHPQVSTLLCSNLGLFTFLNFSTPLLIFVYFTARSEQIPYEGRGVKGVPGQA